MIHAHGTSPKSMAGAVAGAMSLWSPVTPAGSVFAETADSWSQLDSPVLAMATAQGRVLVRPPEGVNGR